MNFAPAELRWADILDTPSVRYGKFDATPNDIKGGDGQHVGTAVQLLNRLEAAF